jgi:predicted HicB family RNase H-like nuclease
MTAEQLQARIKNIPAVAPDEIDMQMIAEYEEEDSDESTSWEEYKTERTYSGNLSLRIPKDLHKALVRISKE